MRRYTTSRNSFHVYAGGAADKNSFSSATVKRNRMLQSTLRERQGNFFGTFSLMVVAHWLNALAAFERRDDGFDPDYGGID
ncbi:hypothetical protein EVAR_52968_1 [Eumeta japonica]|uniref:Uncharacterized protein n=1 Tax=Eumeta variegata TaxID=151549 RepID=A0A4C1YXJ9_EUMVA|nr:hypothetical protein EVAR_52968_1 [Eumeta japonica]